MYRAQQCGDIGEMFKIYALPFNIYTHFCYHTYTDNSPISYLLLQTLFLIACFISSPRYPKYLQKSKSKSFYPFSLISTSDDPCIPYEENGITNPFPQDIQITNLTQSWFHSFPTSVSPIRVNYKSFIQIYSLLSTPKFRPSPFLTLIIIIYVTHVDNNR